MRMDLTDVTVVLDRSGSMSACKEEAENGVNFFVAAQQKQPGSCQLTLVQFDTEYEVVHLAKPVAQVPKFELEPRGMTALLDAVGRAITETGQRLAALPEAQRPGLVAFVIVTDGAENSSHLFTRAKIKEMIQHQQHVYSWKFTFMGANQDAFAEAQSMGIAAADAANYSVAKSEAAFANAGAKVSRMRKAASAGEIAESPFTDEERKSMM